MRVEVADLVGLVVRVGEGLGDDVKTIVAELVGLLGVELAGTRGVSGGALRVQAARKAIRKTATGQRKDFIIVATRGEFYAVYQKVWVESRNKTRCIYKMG